jgi:hypothetical protein
MASNLGAADPLRGSGTMIAKESLRQAISIPDSNAVVQALILPKKLSFIGNYLPRQCGLATFTTDLCNAIAAEYGDERLFAIAVNDPDSTYDYPERVRLGMDQEDCPS